MLFSLEVLKAKHGDCLLLHCGTKTKPAVWVIDGGPPGVFNATLMPRLLAIKQNLNKSVLPLPMVMVSHLDDDHINGIEAMTDDMVQMQDNHQTIPFSIENLWCNNFDDIVGNIQLPAAAASVAGVANVASATAAKGFPKLSAKDSHITAVIASVDQGRNVRNNAAKLGLTVNKPFKAPKKGQAIMVRGDVGQKAISLTGTKITVLHPNTARLEKLQKAWDKELKKAADKGDKKVIMATIAELITATDTSPYNLSSIVCLVEAGGKTILLTGDARMDDVEEGLKKNGLLKSGKLKVDIFKLPHHGSIRNATTSLLKKVTADHYIVSADGNYDNPDKALLDLVADTIKSGTIYFTYEDGKKELGKKMKAFVKKLKTKKSKLKVVFRNENDPSIVIDLGDKLTH